MTAKYRQQLKAHVAEVEKRFGRYGTPFPADVLNDNKLSDSELYDNVRRWRDSIDMGYRMAFVQPTFDGQNSYSDRTQRHLVMYKSGDKYMMVDRSSGDVEAIIHPSRDRLEFVGSEYAINLMGGRERFSRIVQMAEELDEDPHLLHDRRHRAFN